MSHPMSESTAPKTKRSRRWLWAGVALAVVLLLVIGGAVGVFWFQVESLERELQAIIADLDEYDPHWRLRAILAEQSSLPDEQNAALVVISAHGKMPVYWYGKFHLDEPPPPVQLNEVQIANLRQALQNTQLAVEEARTLIEYTEGRYPITYSRDWIGTTLPDIQKAREIAYLLQFDTNLLAQEGKMEEAWKSSRAIYHTSISLGDGNMPVIMKLRLSIRDMALRSMERVLAQGEVKTESLHAMQKLLEDDLQEPILLTALRGERAGQHQLFRVIEEGTISLEPLKFGGHRPNWAIEEDNDRQMPKQVEKVISFVNIGTVKQAHIYILKHLTQMIDKVKKLDDETLHQEMQQIEREIETDATNKDIHIVAAVFVWESNRMVEADIRTRTQMHCAICALATERYRLKHQRWPENLGALVDVGLLTKVPIDPYDGKPLRYRQTKNGIIVYSVGENKDNKGDALDNPDLEEPPFRIEFRLWNPDRRRQPVRAK